MWYSKVNSKVKMGTDPGNQGRSPRTWSWPWVSHLWCDGLVKRWWWGFIPALRKHMSESVRMGYIGGSWSEVDHSGSQRSFQRFYEVKIIFIIIPGCHCSFSLDWHLHQWSKSTGGLHFWGLSPEQVSGTQPCTYRGESQFHLEMPLIKQ